MVAIDYSGRWDITQATQKVVASGVSAAQVDEALLAKHLCFADVPEPDLLIRSGGEQRISNFMLWQCAYSEFFFTDAYWPDFNATLFQQAIDSFQERERRFGYTSEQLIEAEHIA